MKLYYNKATGILATTARGQTSLAKLTVKRMADVALEIIPVDAAGEIELFGVGDAGLLAVKSEHDFTGPLKVLDAAWDAPTEAGRGYTFEFCAGSVGIDAVLGTDAAKTFALEITITSGGRRLVLPTIQLVIENNYYREDEPIPDDPLVPYPPAEEIVVEAPQDGKLYVRRDGEWVEAADPHLFTAPDGSHWLMSITNAGLPTFEKLP